MKDRQGEQRRIAKSVPDSAAAAQKVTQGQLDPEEAKGYVSDLMGVDYDKRQEFTRSLIRTIAHVHSRGFLHRDIKPANCMVGYGDDDMIYLSDFGLSKRFLQQDGAHIPITKKEGVTGTPRFCSVNVHEKIESSRRDDLESIFYVMIYMIKGELPWQGCKNKENAKQNIVTNTFDTSQDGIYLANPESAKSR